MLIQTTQVLKDYEGNDVKQPKEGPDGTAQMVPFTVRDAISMAINNWPNEDPTPEDKATAYRLSVLLYSDAMAELNIEDAAFIKKRCAKVSSPLVYGRVCEILENAAQLLELPLGD